MVTSLSLHKRILSLTIIILIIIGSTNFSFTEKINSGVSIDNFSLSSSSSFKITGSFIATNNDSTESPDLWYTTQLYLDYSLDKSDLVNYKANPINLSAYETRKVTFTHEIPFSIPRGSYSMVMRIYNINGEVLCMAYKDLGTLGGNTPFLQLNSSSSYFSVSGNQVNLMDNPKFQKGETPLIKASLNNISPDIINARPKITIYRKSIYLDSKPVLTAVYPNSLTFEPGKQMQFDIKLPAMTQPDSYYANIVMLDENNLPISGVIEAKYVVSGASAKIFDAKTSYGAGKLVVKGSVIGSSGEGTLTGAKASVEAFDLDGTSIYKAEKEFDLGSSLEQIFFEKYVKIYSKSIKVVLKVEYNSYLLDKVELPLVIDNLVNLSPEPVYTPAPTAGPTSKPTPTPIQVVLVTPTTGPEYTPTPEPTPEPTAKPTPTYKPLPSPRPSTNTTPIPAAGVSPTPKTSSTPIPSTMPTYEPTAEPTPEPTVEPTVEPTPTISETPTEAPTSTPTPNAGYLLDIPGTIYEKAVTELYNLGIIKGYSNNYFKPKDALTRAEFLVLVLKYNNNGQELVPSSELCPFTDVSQSLWAYGYIQQGIDTGLFTGYPDGRFKPQAYVTYAEVLTVASRLLANEAERKTLKKWPTDYSNFAKKHNLTKGMTYKLSAKINRGNVSRIIYNLYNAMKARGQK